MATLKNKSGHTVTTSYAPEIISLRAQGYIEVPEAKFENGGELPAVLLAISNETGRAEAVKPLSKPSK